MDLQTGTARSYSCLNCCPDSFANGFATPDPFSAFPGTQQGFTAWQQDRNCFGTLLSPYTVSFANWHSSATSVFSMTSSGTANCLAPGTGFAQADWTAQQWQFIWIESSPPCEETLMAVGGEGDVKVKPQITGISPAQGLIGATVTVTLTGSFGTGPSISVSGSGVTASITSSSGTSITAKFTISSTAAAGSRTVTVSTAGGLSNPVSFSVQPVTITLDKDMVTLLENNTATISEPGVTPRSFRVEIQRVGETTWFSLGTSQTVMWNAKAAGKFNVRGVVISNGAEFFSANKPLEVKFPSFADIVGNADVQTKTDAAWQNTLNATTSTSRREEGFWIRFNTGTGKYEFSATIVGPTASNKEDASVSLGNRPADTPQSPSPIDNVTYTVADFHTHTPTTFRTFGRGVGPSSADQQGNQDQDAVGIVYDYEPSPSGGTTIPAGHPLNSAAKRWASGPTRRSTPQ